MAPKTILDESEAEWAKDFRYATLARMSLSEHIRLAREKGRVAYLGEGKNRLWMMLIGPHNRRELNNTGESLQKENFSWLRF